MINLLIVLVLGYVLNWIYLAVLFSDPKFKNMNSPYKALKVTIEELKKGLIIGSFVALLNFWPIILFTSIAVAGILV